VRHVEGVLPDGRGAEERKTIWKTVRDELPSWSTPTIYAGKGRTVLVTNAPNFIRGKIYLGRQSGRM